MGDDGVTAFYQILEVTALLEEDTRVSMEREGLTPARAKVLWLAGQSPAPTQKVVAEALGVSARNVTGLVDALVADGFVRRVPHPTDRRASLVEPTERGRRVLASMAAGQEEAVALLFGGLSAERLATHLRTMEEVLVRLREHAIRAEPGEVS